MYHFETPATDTVAPIHSVAAPAQKSDLWWLAALWRRRFSILAFGVLGALIGLAYGFLATERWVATTQLLIDPRDVRAVQNDLNPQGVMSEAAVAIVESQARVLTSNSVLRRVIQQENLAADPEFNGTPTTAIEEIRHAVRRLWRDPEPADPELEALRELRRGLDARRTERTYVLDVAVASQAPAKSARIANAVASAYLEEQASARSDVARRVSASLSGRLNELRQRVETAEQAVERYKVQNNIVTANGRLVNESQLTEISTQLVAVRARAAEARARYEQIRAAQRAGADGGAFAEAVGSTTVGTLRAQLSEAARQEADLSANLGPRSPQLQAAQAQIRNLRRTIAEEIARLAASAQADLARATANEQALTRSLDNLKREAVTTNQASVRLRELERDLEASRTIYEAFLVRARETGEQERLDTTNARVISEATPPRDRAWPRRSIIVPGALLLGLGFGAFWVLARALLRRHKAAA